MVFYPPSPIPSATMCNLPDLAPTIGLHISYSSDLRRHIGAVPGPRSVLTLHARIHNRRRARRHSSSTAKLAMGNRVHRHLGFLILVGEERCVRASAIAVGMSSFSTSIKAAPRSSLMRPSMDGTQHRLRRRCDAPGACFVPELVDEKGKGYHVNRRKLRQDRHGLNTSQSRHIRHGSMCCLRRKRAIGEGR